MQFESLYHFTQAMTEVAYSIEMLNGCLGPIIQLLSEVDACEGVPDELRKQIAPLVMRITEANNRMLSAYFDSSDGIDRSQIPLREEDQPSAFAPPEDHEPSAVIPAI